MFLSFYFVCILGNEHDHSFFCEILFPFGVYNTSLSWFASHLSPFLTFLLRKWKDSDISKEQQLNFHPPPQN